MEYTYKVSGVKVYDTDTQKDVVKEATFHITGTKDGKSYDSFLPMEFTNNKSGCFRKMQNKLSQLTSTAILATPFGIGRGARRAQSPPCGCY